MILNKEQFELYNEAIEELNNSGDYKDARNILYELLYDYESTFSDEELAHLITAIDTREEISDGAPIKYYKILTEGGYLYYSKLYKNLAYSETPVRVREDELKSIFSNEYITQHRDVILDWED